MTATLRRGPLHLGAPKAPNCPPGFCRWCGEAIVLLDPSDYRRARRRYHYGDEHEEGNKDCLSRWKGSTVWNTRIAVRRRDFEAKGAVACEDCGVVCVEKAAEDRAWTDPDGIERREGQRVELVVWEADHQIPLEDGGPHTLDNLRCRCVPCHRTKTAREATERATRRRSARRRSTQPEFLETVA